PQRCGCVVVGLALRVRTGRGEQQVAGGRERRGGLALRTAGEPPRRAFTPRVDLPERRDVARALPVEALHRRDEPGAVGAEHQPAEAAEGQVRVEVVERGLRGRRRSVLGHADGSTTTTRARPTDISARGPRSPAGTPGGTPGEHWPNTLSTGHPRLE